MTLTLWYARSTVITQQNALVDSNDLKFLNTHFWTFFCLHTNTFHKLCPQTIETHLLNYLNLKDVFNSDIICFTIWHTIVCLINGLWVNFVWSVCVQKKLVQIWLFTNFTILFMYVLMLWTPFLKEKHFISKYKNIITCTTLNYIQQIENFFTIINCIFI